MEEKPVLFPKYIEREFKSRTLGFLHEKIIMTEYQHVYEIPDFQTMLGIVFNHNLLTFTGNIPTFPYLSEVIAMGDKPFCSEDGTPLGIRLKGSRNTSRWVASAKAWGITDYLDNWLETHPETGYRQAVQTWLALMRRAYDTGGVGTPPSPGAWGMAMFRQSFKQQYGEDWHVKRHRRPPGAYAERIRYESSGARSEVLQINVKFPVAYENDAKNAYGAALRQAQPTGKCYKVKGDRVGEFYPFYFVECEVTIHAQLRLGVFPVRMSAGRERHPVFPTRPGVYRAWLWHREIALCREEGLTVQILEGFGWCEATYDFAPVVEKISQLRDSAPSDVKPLLKLALVALVGRLGMPEERYVIVPAREKADGDRCIAHAGIAYDWWIHQEFDSYPQSMPHIFSHTLMICRLNLYTMAKYLMEQEMNIIATNTDAVITEKRLESIPDKGTHVETGEWTALELHEVIVKANRHLNSLEKNVNPGIPKKAKR